MPPVMGAAAFIMADTLGVSYWGGMQGSSNTSGDVLPGSVYFR